LVVPGETADSSSLLLISFDKAVRPLWACGRPDRTPRTPGRPRRACLDHRRDRKRRPRAGNI